MNGRSYRYIFIYIFILLPAIIHVQAACYASPGMAGQKSSTCYTHYDRITAVIPASGLAEMSLQTDLVNVHSVSFHPVPFTRSRHAADVFVHMAGASIHAGAWYIKEGMTSLPACTFLIFPYHYFW